MNYTTQAQVRAAFVADYDGPLLFRGAKPAPQNRQPADARSAFVEYVDALARAGAISDALAQRVTL